MWDSTELTRLIADHLARHPALQLRDVYKLLYQGILGPEHLVSSPERFAAFLEKEYGPLEPPLKAQETEPLWEPVRPDGRLGRINLRPFKARGGDLAGLVRACLATARERWGTPEELRSTWALFVQQCREGRWGHFPDAEVEEFTAWLEEEKYPVVHHSGEYREAERPAYRLSSRLQVDKLQVERLRD